MTEITVGPLILINREPWTEDAACRGLWDLFDEQGTTRHSTYEPAIRICREFCPVLAECAEYAQRVSARDGVWGGVLINAVGRPTGLSA